MRMWQTHVCAWGHVAHEVNDDWQYTLDEHDAYVRITATILAVVSCRLLGLHVIQ